jgi:hypothetical protein
VNARSSILCGLLAAATIACAATHPARFGSAQKQTIPSDGLVLEVENHNWSDVLIYVVHDGTSTRFLDLSAAKSGSREIPPRFVSSSGMIRFLVHRIGGDDDYLSPQVSVRTGSTVSLTLESDLRRSSLGVW